MDDSFLRDVEQVLQRKSEAEIRHALTTVKPGGRDASIYQAAIQKIEADRSQKQETRVEERHRETLYEDRFARKIAFVALLLAAFALGMEVWDRFGPREPKTEEYTSPPEHRTAISEGQRSSTMTPSSSLHE